MDKTEGIHIHCIESICLLWTYKAFDSVDHDVLPDRYSPGKSSRPEVQLQACSFIKKETLKQAFSCEFCKISKNTFSYKTTLGDCFYRVALGLILFINYSLIQLVFDFYARANLFD